MAKLDPIAHDRYCDQIEIFCDVAQIHPDSVGSARMLLFWIENLSLVEAQEVCQKLGWIHLCDEDPDIDPSDVLHDMFDGSRIEAGLVGLSEIDPEW